MGERWGGRQLWIRVRIFAALPFVLMHSPGFFLNVQLLFPNFSSKKSPSISSSIVAFIFELQQTQQKV